MPKPPRPARCHSYRPWLSTTSSTKPIKNLLGEKGPSKSQILTMITLFPLCGILLLLAAFTFIGSLIGSLIGLVVTTPLFVIFSPVLVPAALTIVFAVAGFLTSGAFGITALSSFTWIINYARNLLRGSVPEQFEYAKRRVQDTAGQMGQRAQEAMRT